VPEAPDRQELLSALTTEHFTLQTARSQTASESASRASLYILSVSIAAVVLAGCGSGDRTVDRSSSATPPYGGSLNAEAAVDALECDGKTPYWRAEGEYGSGLATVQESAEAALDDYMREEGLSLVVPSEGYALEREQDGRALLSYDVDGRTKVALVTADDVRDWDRNEGWGVRAWAQCDPSELPPDVTDDLNIGVWEDESGARVPVTRIQSFQGAEHCDWTDITFLLLGPERRADWYVRDVRPEFPALLRTTFSDDAKLPADATDTGLRRDGRQLWITETAAYLVSLDDAGDVERWPAAKQRIGCA
jgi:hypothetical protein